MHNFDVPHASKTVNHAPTQSEVHIKRTTYDGPLPPSSTDNICSNHNMYNPKKSSLMVKLINLSRCRSK